MTTFIEIHWTCGSLDEARRVSRFLVQEKLVACAQIIPWIESIYTWDSQLETMQESKVILKTQHNLYEKVREVIEKNCSYEVPEITFRDIAGGNELFLNWMKEGTSAAVLTSHNGI